MIGNVRVAIHELGKRLHKSRLDSVILYEASCNKTLWDHNFALFAELRVCACVRGCACASA